MTLKTALQNLRLSGSLDAELIELALDDVFHHEVCEDEVREFLSLLYQKGETPEEIAGAVNYLRRQAIPLSQKFPEAVDCCGTGGDQQGTLNISTAVAFVLAGEGVQVAKHGNRAVSSLSGSADVLKELGVNVEMPLETTLRCLDKSGITFLWAPQYYPILQKVAAVRRSLPHRTIFNLVGPLLNPLYAGKQLLGVFDSSFVPVLAKVLQRTGSTSAVVVASEDGLDEFSLTAKSRVTKLSQGRFEEFVFDPWVATGYPRCDLSKLKGGTPAENALRLKKTLKGHSEAVDHVVHINAAWGFVVAGKAKDFMDGLLLAQDSISSGRAFLKLEELVELSHAR